MESRLSDLLVNELVLDDVVNHYTDHEWEILLRQARASGVLARLYFFWHEFEKIEPAVFFIPHLESANKYWLSQQRIVNWEIYHLKQVFHQLKIPLVLLKGTAYCAAGLNAGLGRIFNDIDILVPKAYLWDVKEALKWNGWFSESLDSYDKRYYEQWMHELPPMRHIHRGTSLDVHHNILPRTCVLCPDADLLLKGTVEVADGLRILSPEDMVLHSASHLFWGGEFENGLRDLSDIDLLLREFSAKDEFFWQKLFERAKELGLGKPLFYALRYTNRLLQTPIPDEIIAACTIFGSGRFKKYIMDYVFIKALKPFHPVSQTFSTPLAIGFLYLRSHWLKMPLHILIPHLLRKSWLRLQNK